MRKRAVSGVDVIRAAASRDRPARLPRPARRRLDRRPCGPQRRLRQQRRPRGHRGKPAPRRSQRSCRAPRSPPSTRSIRRRPSTSTQPWPQDERPHADAMVTDRPGLLLGILTADCAPVLFADPEAGVVGAAHAGWRGAIAGVTDATIAAMERLGAKRERIAAAVGPCIAQPSYEVDEAFRAALPRRPIRTTSASSSPARTGSRISTSRPMSPHRLAARGHRRSRGARPRHLCRPGPFLQLPPRDPSRRSRLRPPDQPDRPPGNFSLTVSGRAA